MNFCLAFSPLTAVDVNNEIRLNSDCRSIVKLTIGFQSIAQKLELLQSPKGGRETKILNKKNKKNKINYNDYQGEINLKRLPGN